MKKLVVAALAAAAALAPVTPASAANGLIQPGDYMEAGGSACTTNFVFDGTGSLAGRVYVGTAAHCVSSVGQDVKNISNQTWGDVAIIGNAGTTQGDWALVEVRETFESSVSAAVKGYPAYPTGYTAPADTAVGDRVQISGYGIPFYATKTTQEQRFGLMNSDTVITYNIIGPITWGDSGGPLVHVRTGKALGIVSRLCVGDGICTETGPTVQGILDALTAANFPVTLRTV